MIDFAAEFRNRQYSINDIDGVAKVTAIAHTRKAYTPVRGKHHKRDGRARVYDTSKRNRNPDLAVPTKHVILLVLVVVQVARLESLELTVSRKETF